MRFSDFRLFGGRLVSEQRPDDELQASSRVEANPPPDPGVWTSLSALLRQPGRHEENRDGEERRITPAAAPDEFKNCSASVHNGTADGPKGWLLCTPFTGFEVDHDGTGNFTYTSPNAILAYNPDTDEYRSYPAGGTGAFVTIDSSGRISGSTGL